MSEWKEYNLEDLSNILIGGTPSRSISSYWANENENGYKWVAISDISLKKFISDTSEKVTESGYKASNTKLLPIGTVIFSFKLTLGKKAITKVELLTNEAIAGFITNKKLVDDEFLYYYLEVIDYSKVTDTAVKGITLNKQKLRILKLRIPDLPVQYQIAKILSNSDAIIENTQATIDKYKSIKQGLLHDLFTRGINISTGKLRSKYEDSPEFYKESKLGMVPKEWEDCKMGRYILSSLYGPRFNAKDYAVNGNVKTIRGTDFTKVGNILYQQAPKALLPNDLINSHKLEDGDIIIVTTADCGLTAVFEKPINDVDFIPSAYSVKYRFSKNVNPYFVKYFMATDCAVRQVNKFIRQGTLGNLPGSDILNFEMIYPSIDEQDKIVEILLIIDKKLQSEQKYLLKLQQLKIGLMADLLSGKKRVKMEVS